MRLKRTGAAAPDAKLVIVDSVSGQRRVVAACPLAEAAGLRVGMPLAQARAICPGLTTMAADPAGDRAGLAALATWAERYTPLAAADPPDGLLLDIAGCAHLFGGEAALAADLLARLAGNGLPARVAIAGTAAAAWALARAGRDGVTLLPAGRETSALADLPVALLRLEARVVTGLRRFGVRRIAELARLPRGGVVARFGAHPVLRLDQAFGAADEPVAWPHPPAPWRERRAFAEPIGTAEDLARALAWLAARLCARLAVARQGGQRFVADFRRVDATRAEIVVATARPVRDPVYLAKLLVAKLETVDPGFGVEAMLLEADSVGPLDPAQTGLTDLAEPVADALATMVDALANRLGVDRVWRPAPFPSHVPERAVRRLPPLAPEPPSAPPGVPAAARPLRLFARPEPIEATAPVPDDPPGQFRWRGCVHRVRAASGPERIAAEWWRGQGRVTEARDATDMVRDYYRVEDEEGGRFWLFRTGRHAGTQGTGWYLHGVFG